MELKLNEIIYDKNVKGGKTLIKKRSYKREKIKVFGGITVLKREKSRYYCDKNSFILLFFNIIFIIGQKFPKCFLEILVFINLKILISPKHLGNFGQ